LNSNGYRISNNNNNNGGGTIGDSVHSGVLTDVYAREPRRYLREIIAVGGIQKLSSTLRDQLQGSGVIMQDCASTKASAADMAIMAEILKVYIAFIYGISLWHCIYCLLKNHSFMLLSCYLLFNPPCTIQTHV
jgi:hypothetical protein